VLLHVETKLSPPRDGWLRTGIVYRGAEAFDAPYETHRPAIPPKDTHVEPCRDTTLRATFG
jgi:hypothetical protein